MVSCVKRCMALFLCFISIFIILPTSMVYAGREDIDAVEYVGENQAELVRVCAKANDLVGVEILVYTGNDGLLSFSNKKYSELAPVDKRKFMEASLGAIKRSGLEGKVKNVAYNFIADQDTSVSATVKFLKTDAGADLASALVYFQPFSSAFGIILGIFSLLTFIFIALSFLADMAYIFLADARTVLSKKEGERPKFVSREAYISVRKAEEELKSSEYSNVLSSYMKRRLPIIILLAVCIMYLISGQIYDLLVYIADSFSWIFAIDNNV